MAKQQDIDPGGVDVGQLGQVADPHEQFRVRPALACDRVPRQTGCETGSNRFQDRVDPIPDVVPIEELQGVFQRPWLAGIVGDGDHFAAPIEGGFPIAGIDRQDEFGTGGDRVGDLSRLQAVDGDSQPGIAQRSHAIGDTGPAFRSRVHSRRRSGRHRRHRDAMRCARVGRSSQRGAWLISATIWMS